MPKVIDLRATAEAVSKALIEKGLFVEAGWVGLKMMSLPPDAPQAQFDEMRMAFFAGAHHVFAGLMGALDDGDDITEQDLQRAGQIHEELERFVAEFKRKHGMDN